MSSISTLIAAIIAMFTALFGGASTTPVQPVITPNADEVVVNQAHAPQPDKVYELPVNAFNGNVVRTATADIVTYSLREGNTICHYEESHPLSGGVLSSAKRCDM